MSNYSRGPRAHGTDPFQASSVLSEARAALQPVKRDRELNEYKQEELRKMGIKSQTKPLGSVRGGGAPLGSIGSLGRHSRVTASKALLRGAGGLKLPSIQGPTGSLPLPALRRFGHGNALPDSTANIWQQDATAMLRNEHHPALHSPIHSQKGVLGASPTMEGTYKSKKKRNKRSKKQRKKEKKAALVLQNFVRKKMCTTWAAIKLQRVVRGHLGRNYAEMRKSAQQAGVMVAIRGTAQGKSGWYQDFDGTIYFFAVDLEGTWWQVVEQKEWDERRDDLENIPVLVCQKKTKKGSDGVFKEYGHPGKKNGNKKWKQTPSGHWTRVKMSIFG